jgi:hypothetical protein
MNHIKNYYFLGIWDYGTRFKKDWIIINVIFVANGIYKTA